MNKKKLSIFILFAALFLNYNIYSQVVTQNIEQYTLTLFLNKDFKKLIHTGEEAISEGVDYYYLRYRIGVAYYELNNYRMAAYHLEKAFNFNSDDPANQEYLYYSYVFSGRTNDANYFSTKLNEDVKVRVQYKTKIINSIYAESGISKSNNVSKTTAADINGAPDIYGETDLNSDIFYGHLGLKHEISPRISIYHGFSYLKIDKSRIYSLFLRDTTINYSAIQNEYYINGDIQVKSGLKLTPAFHYIHVSSDIYNFSTDTLPYESRISSSKLNATNYLISLALTKDYKKITAGIFATYSNLNNAKQIEGGLSFMYFPFGNLNLYTSTNLTYFFQKNSGGQGQGSTNESRIIIDQMIGFKIFPKLWTEVAATFGEMQNYNEKNAFIVYNIPDKLKFKAGMSLIYSLSDKIELSLRYQFLSKESTYSTQLNLNSFNTNSINYQNNTIIGGIKWKF